MSAVFPVRKKGSSNHLSPGHLDEALISFKCQRYGQKMAKSAGMQILPRQRPSSMLVLPGRWRLSDVRRT